MAVFWNDDLIRICNVFTKIAKGITYVITDGLFCNKDKNAKIMKNNKNIMLTT